MTWQHRNEQGAQDHNAGNEKTWGPCSLHALPQAVTVTAGAHSAAIHADVDITRMMREVTVVNPKTQAMQLRRDALLPVLVSNWL